jgi:hypothetical protein
MFEMKEGVDFTVWLDAATGLPVKRASGREGAERVETFREFALDAPVAESELVLPK